ncbi:MAG TPA: Phenylacetic acid catabolic protein, partial [Phycisphaerales bacterium]|nr:Phenylacetic acid catabolic protein [Phycisphaerales bacterium]
QLQHLSAWMIRLGQGSDESRMRMQTAIISLASEAGMMFEPSDATLTANESFCCGRDEMFRQWIHCITPTLRKAGLDADIQLPSSDTVGGRRGNHASHFTEQLAEMTEVIGTDATASW